MSQATKTLPDYEKLPIWLLPVRQELGRLLALPDNWDSYGAPAIHHAYIAAVIEFLRKVMQDQSPAPSIVPTSGGGIQLEWHTRGVDLEVEFLSPVRIYATFEDGKTGDFWEADLSFDLSRMLSAVARLSQPS